jgi:hypothetical protein
MNQNKVAEYLLENIHKKKLFEQDYFDLGICEVVLGNFSNAMNYFVSAVTRMFEDRPYWRASSQVNWLVEISVLSGRTEIFPSVLEELRIYQLSSTKSHPGGNSPLAHYCYSVMEILYPSSGKLDEWIGDLLKRPKYKDLYAAGLTLQSIRNHDQSGFNQSFQMLLKVHEGQAKLGGLRWSPQAWLCLHAMTLAYLAVKKDLEVTVSNEYFSLGYLKFLLDREVSGFEIE